MGFNPKLLWAAPEINPVNHKARSIPALNPFNIYGRVFLFSWWGFMIAFWSWYAFPPLLTVTIKKDLKLTQTDIANSNIIALVATLIVRVIAGPCCDRWGPRYTFAGCLLAGAIPTALAGAVFNAPGLLVLRFFIGILGGAFVPCQVWATGFFDKNIVGSANALTAGLGNSGGGITYFVMPAIFESLVHARGLSAHVAWRVAFIVPFILITATAILMILLCPDTPLGNWSDRQLHVQENLQSHHVIPNVTTLGEQGLVAEKDAPKDPDTGSQEKIKIDPENQNPMFQAGEAHISAGQMLETAQGEVIVKPSFKEAMAVTFSLSTLVPMATYFCTFGAELSINSILGTYYLKQFPHLGQSGTGDWAAMFGLLNVVCRPLGGFFSDLVYARTKSLWAKKMLAHCYALCTGAFQIAIGVTNSKKQSTMFGLYAGLAFFLEGTNGAIFSFVPHIHPFANGIVSGLCGATGNLGGVVFAIIFRYLGTDYGRAMWIIGVITIAINIATCWIRPISKNQVGGR